MDADARPRSCFPLPLGAELLQNLALTTDLSALSKGAGPVRERGFSRSYRPFVDRRSVMRARRADAR